MSSDGSQVVESWISYFCNKIGHEYFAEVSEDFIEDDFNLTGLSSQVDRYKEALEMILDVEPEDDDEEEEEEDEEDEASEAENERQLAYRRADRRASREADMTLVENSAELLYGLIHQRYITSRPGIGEMHAKYEASHFGSCPRVFCNGARVLPVGIYDTPRQDTVKLFCPSCLDVYIPPNSRFQNVDGAFFGTTFGCLFFMTFPDLAIAPPRPRDRNREPSRSADEAMDDNSELDEDIDAPTPTPATPALPQPAEINGVATSNLAPGLGAINTYAPRIYGFRVAEISRSGPRMSWLRSKPIDIRELEESRRFHELHGSDPDAAAIVLEPALPHHLPDQDLAPGAAAAQQTQQQQATQEEIDRRKKAPMRKRRISRSSQEAWGGPGGAGTGGSDRMLNGVG